MSSMSKSLRAWSSSSFAISTAATTAALVATLGACNPYERQSGEYSAGAIDPVKFPKQYLGGVYDGDGNATRPVFGAAGAANHVPRAGVFKYAIAWVRGEAALYYALPVNGDQNTDPPNFDVVSLSPPLGYVFDPEGSQAAADSDKCKKPMDYQFDRQLEAVRGDRQGNIFSVLPEADSSGATSYVPIVSEVVVHSGTNPCQGIKSAESVVQRNDVELMKDPPPKGLDHALPIARPSGKFLAYAIIDPAAEVRMPTKRSNCAAALGPTNLKSCEDVITQKTDALPIPGLGPQRWGWYQQYLLAYLDGGYIPLSSVAPASCKSKMCFKIQNVYYPDKVQVVDAETGKTVEKPGTLGMGLDIMDYKRGEDQYTPICHVWSFPPNDTSHPETSVAQVDMSQLTDKGYVYCLQTP